MLQACGGLAEFSSEIPDITYVCMYEPTIITAHDN